MTITITVPDGAALLEAARVAGISSLRLVSNGRRTALSSVVPPGWEEVAVRTIDDERTPDEAA